MALTPEDDRVLADLDLLQQIQLSGMNPAEREAFQKEITRIDQEYKQAREEANNQNLDKAKRELAQKRVEATAKAVPVMVKGILTAASAFDRGDNLTGAAAILDIAGAALGLLALAGPAGAMAGALGAAILSSIGQILIFFAPKPPSMIEQIDTLLAKYSALDKIADLKSVGKAINAYRSNLQASAKLLQPVMQNPPTTNEELEKLSEAMNIVVGVLLGATIQSAPAVFANWGVYGWLDTSPNASNELWPQVLGLWCQANRDLLIANITLQSLANRAQIDVLLKATKKENNPHLNDRDLDRANESIRKLNENVQSLQILWKSNNQGVLAALTGFVAGARERGLYLQLGTKQRVYTAVGKAAGDLQWKQYADNTSNLSINLPNGLINYEFPELDVFTCTPVGSSNPGIYRHKLYPTKGDLKKGPIVLAQSRTYATQNDPRTKRFFNDCVDVCWIPENANPSIARVYTAHYETKPRPYSYINIHHVDADNKAWWIHWEPGGMLSDLQHVRALYAPPSPLPDDPDGDGLPKQDQPDAYQLIYGGYKLQKTIWVASHDSWAGVPAPWDKYTGIETDQDFIWTFLGNSLACATHASMVRCKDGKISKPGWITYTLKGSDFAKALPNVSAKDRDNLAKDATIASISPCADGTFSIAIKMKSDYFMTTTYAVSVKDKDKKILLAPFILRNSQPTSIYKVQIPCWQLFQSLRADLILDSFLPNTRQARLKKPAGALARKSKPARTSKASTKRSAKPAATSTKKKAPASRSEKSPARRATR